MGVALNVYGKVNTASKGHTEKVLSYLKQNECFEHKQGPVYCISNEYVRGGLVPYCESVVFEKLFFWSSEYPEN